MQLKSAIGSLNTYGVKAIADIVINHRVGTPAGRTSPTPSGARTVAQGDEWTSATGAPDTGDGYGAARDIDHTNGTVQTDRQGWMNLLKSSIGFDGWRYDYVKGYGGTYVGTTTRHGALLLRGRAVDGPGPEQPRRPPPAAS